MGRLGSWAVGHRANLHPVYVEINEERQAAAVDPEEPIMIDRDPDDDMGYPWHVIVDMRRDDTTANYEWTDAVKAKLGDLDIMADPETSCSYFYCKTEADAKFVATVVRSVWEAGLG